MKTQMNLHSAEQMIQSQSFLSSNYEMIDVFNICRVTNQKKVVLDHPHLNLLFFHLETNQLSLISNVSLKFKENQTILVNAVKDLFPKKIIPDCSEWKKISQKGFFVAFRICLEKKEDKVMISLPFSFFTKEFKDTKPLYTCFNRIKRFVDSKKSNCGTLQEILLIYKEAWKKFHIEVGCCDGESNLEKKVELEKEKIDKFLHSQVMSSYQKIVQEKLYDLHCLTQEKQSNKPNPYEKLTCLQKTIFEKVSSIFGTTNGSSEKHQERLYELPFDKILQKIEEINDFIEEAINSSNNNNSTQFKRRFVAPTPIDTLLKEVEIAYNSRTGDVQTKFLKDLSEFLQPYTKQNEGISMIKEATQRSNLEEINCLHFELEGNLEHKDAPLSDDILQQRNHLHASIPQAMEWSDVIDLSYTNEE